MSDIDLITCERDKLREDKAALVEALNAATQVLATLYSLRRANGGAGQQAFEKARETLAKHGGDNG